MNSNHFSYFRTKNFKRFRDLEVRDIGQFNLILGDNNVGKTSLLEALMFDRMDEFILALGRRLSKRNMGGELTDGVWGLLVNNDAKLSESNEVITEFFPNNAGFQYSFSKVTKKLRDIKGGYAVEKILEGIDISANGNEIQNPRDFGGPIDYFEPLISNLDRHDYSLTKQFSRLVNRSESNLEYDLFNSLRTIDSSIKDIRYDDISSNQPLLSVGTENQKGRTLLALFGDGTIILFRILLYIHLLRGKKLMIDDMDAGIYYGRMKEYWKTILVSAQKNHVQLFASTHNIECIKSYHEALEELGKEYQSKSRAIHLVEHEQTRDVIAFTNSYEKMVEDLTIGNEIR